MKFWKFWPGPGLSGPRRESAAGARISWTHRPPPRTLPTPQQRRPTLRYPKTKKASTKTERRLPVSYAQIAKARFAVGIFNATKFALRGCVSTCIAEIKLRTISNALLENCGVVIVVPAGCCELLDRLEELRLHCQALSNQIVKRLLTAIPGRTTHTSTS